MTDKEKANKIKSYHKIPDELKVQIYDNFEEIYNDDSNEDYDI